MLLDITPECLENGRSVSYRCSFQCGTASNDVNDWYRLCQKVSSGRRAAAKGYLRKRQADWQQTCRDVERANPGASKSRLRDNRPQADPRALGSHDADIMELDHDARKRIMSVFSARTFRQSLESSIPIARWTSSGTTNYRINQHFICQDLRRKLVIDSRHWLRQISHRESIRLGGGKYTCPHSLVTYCPWAPRPILKAPKPQT